MTQESEAKSNMNDFENTILKIITDHPGIGAKDIAQKLKCNKRSVNSALFGKLKSHCYQDKSTYKWYLKSQHTETSHGIVHSKSKENETLDIKYQELQTKLLTQQDTISSLETRCADLTKTNKNLENEFNEKIKILEEERNSIKQKFDYLRAINPKIDTIFDDETISSKFFFFFEPEDNTDRAIHYLDDKEYKKLSPTVRNQRALDNYIKGKKTKWQIGRDYELYIGYLCAQNGYTVHHTGIQLRFEDMGIDLIVFDKKSVNTYLVQCKNWSHETTIHEKHLFQLYGSSVLYKVYNRMFEDNIKPVFVTTTKLSKKAQEVADDLGIEVRYIKMGEFPRIKCNINKQGKKIYHLPFDQQYDRVQSQQYVSTVAEAEKEGFKRAFKWHGKKH